VIVSIISHGIRLLPPLLRNSDIAIYTSTFNNAYENRELEEELGPYFHKELEKITYQKKIERKEKGKAILKIISLKPRIVEFRKPTININLYNVNKKQNNNKHEKIIDEIDNKILVMRIKGHSLREIAKKLNIAHTTVYYRLNKLKKIGINIEN